PAKRRSGQRPMLLLAQNAYSPMTEEVRHCRPQAFAALIAHAHPRLARGLFVDAASRLRACGTPSPATIAATRPTASRWSLDPSAPAAADAAGAAPASAAARAIDPGPDPQRHQFRACGCDYHRQAGQPGLGPEARRVPDLRGQQATEDRTVLRRQDRR